MIAVTDHDTVSGVAIAKVEAKRLGVTLIPGVELSTQFSGASQHLLGYGIDVTNAKLIETLEDFQDQRESRNDKIIEKLQNHGIKITLEDVAALAGKVDSLGRPHIAATMLKIGAISSIQEGFNTYLGKGAKAYVGRRIPTIEEAISIIHQAGGLAVLAHPSSLNLERSELKEYLKKLKESGLDGVEVYSSSHTLKFIKQIKKITTALGFMVTAGSDFHGENKKYVHFGLTRDGKKIRKDWVSPSFLSKLGVN